MAGTLSLPVGTVSSADPLRPGLVAWIRMMGDVTDASGRDNNGTVVNGPLTATTNKYGNTNSAYTFSLSSSQYVSLALNSALPIYSPGASYSIAFWYRSTSAQTGIVYAEGSSANGIGQFALQMTSNKANVRILTSSGTARLDGNTVQATTAIAANTWGHVVWTDSNGTARMYINGVQDATSFNYTPGSLGITPNQARINSVARGTTPAGFMNCSLADFRIYNRALSAAEARTLALAPQRI